VRELDGVGQVLQHHSRPHGALADAACEDAHIGRFL
jgi:hypothetical protein